MWYGTSLVTNVTNVLLGSRCGKVSLLVQRLKALEKAVLCSDASCSCRIHEMVAVRPASVLQQVHKWAMSECELHVHRQLLPGRFLPPLLPSLA
jgi:hypothetical protein